MTREPRIPLSLDEIAFSRRRAIDSGMTSGVLRGAGLQSPFRGVFHRTDYPSDIFWLCRAYLERCRDADVFSHETAALLYSLPLPRYLEASSLHVSRLRGRRSAKGRGVVGHEVDQRQWMPSELIHQDHDRGHLFALPIATPSMVWAQLASSLDREDLVALGDAIVGGETPLDVIDSLEGAVVNWSGSRGVERMRWALPRIRAGVLSRPESLLRLMITRAGMPEPLVNIDVHDEQAQKIATADLVWPEYRVLTEYEGDGHRSRGKFRSDIERFEAYADANWRALRTHGDTVFISPTEYLARLSRALIAGGWRPNRRELRFVAAARR